MNLNVSVVGFLTTAFYIIIFGFMWRFLSTRLSETPFGKAMGTIY